MIHSSTLLDTYIVRVVTMAAYGVPVKGGGRWVARAQHTLTEIKAKALEIIDRDGLAALTMRSLAGALGTGPMTLYNYVRDREGIEELVVDAVISAGRFPRRSEDWQRDVAGIATAMWRALRAHPAAIPLVLTRRSVSPESYAPTDALIEALGRAGLEQFALLAAFRAVLGFVMGTAQAEHAGPLAGSGRDAQAQSAAKHIGLMAGGDYRHVAALSQVARRSTAAGDFTRGLDMLLAGIRAQAMPEPSTDHLTTDRQDQHH
jgi:AcrR family transcriptional regulator